MVKNKNYRMLLLTSIPDLLDTITAMTRQHFHNVESIYWEMGNMETKPGVLKQMEESDYNLIISHVNGIILKRHHLDKAKLGAINIHPGPPEAPGCWGVFCQPIVRRDMRTHHGVTLHEIDEMIDHGLIYAAERWEVGDSDSIESVMGKAMEGCMEMLDFALKKLGASPHGTLCFGEIDEKWDADGPRNVEDVQAWFAALDSSHPAHQERVFMNHPKAIISPPYFSDLV
jgi:methionyl-tRNA formyltransferase